MDVRAKMKTRPGSFATENHEKPLHPEGVGYTSLICPYFSAVFMFHLGPLSSLAYSRLVGDVGMRKRLGLATTLLKMHV